MAVFLSSQLDFIFFCYGLSFILLGTVCFAIGRRKPHGIPWNMLGGFGLLHGGLEWLDLLALIFGDSTVFAALRTALMAVSFLFLFEFARREGIRLGAKLTGPWIYAPVVILVAVGGFWEGVAEANALARYGMGFTAGAATSLVFALHAKALEGSERALAIAAAFGFALYATASGLIVPVAPFWPANVYNYAWFVHWTGVPIQLIRGLLACALALTIGGIWGEKLMREISSSRYKLQLQRLFALTIASLATILVGGWVLTQYLGEIYKDNIQREARGDIALVASNLTAETAMVKGMAKALAGAPSVAATISGNDPRERERTLAVLKLDVESAEAELGQILDLKGRIVATSNPEAATAEDRNYGPQSYFGRALTGRGSQHFAYEQETGRTVFYASAPVRDKSGTLIGVAILKKSLDGFARGLKDFNTPIALVDPYGVVALTNRPAMRSKPLWSQTNAYTTQSEAFRPARTSSSVLAGAAADADWTTIDGTRTYVQRHYAQDSAWSLVTLTTARGIFASRVLGIVITLMATAIMLVYPTGRERWIYDSVQMERRLELEELARDLSFQATTDPLTGINNRLKFDQLLHQEIARAERYGTPLSLLLYDLNHFKLINDTHGHPIGDEVLAEVSRLASSHIRRTDFVARWGGEEFAILIPQGNSHSAFRLARSLRDAVQDQTFAAGTALTCSFGVAEFVPGETAQSFVARADTALYRAKLNGRNRVERAPAATPGKAGLHRVA